MPEALLGELTAEQFLQQYWQKAPCLIRQAMPAFDPGFDGDDLAGLACEPLAEARIIKGEFASGNWELLQGPFEDYEFDDLGEKAWTLLVQDVEKHYPPLATLLEGFSFLPVWRLDDLMVSFAATGGSVGPHVDQYDVFLLQVQGQRRWDISQSFNPALLADAPVNVLREFQPEQGWTLEPGDMLYLPPGIAHHGVALEPGMTFSIGLRAPSAADLFLGLGELLGQDDYQGGRYMDPWLTDKGRDGEISKQAIMTFHSLLEQHLDRADDFETFIGSFLSRYRMAHEPAGPPQTTIPEQVQTSLAEGCRLYRNPWTRMNWVETGPAAQLFAAGRKFDCSIDLAQTLCGPEPINLPSGDPEESTIGLLTELINSGHLILIQE